MIGDDKRSLNEVFWVVNIGMDGEDFLEDEGTNSLPNPEKPKFAFLSKGFCEEDEKKQSNDIKAEESENVGESCKAAFNDLEFPPFRRKMALKCLPFLLQHHLPLVLSEI